ncbi:MAG: adenylate/guanylate cyclase domain-containing protein, partial [Alphaproteobacteria bacterium]|nr:adenylate/guanylate cyclase domain-containing protein [Alphaproteobacteria bacterium]
EQEYFPDGISEDVITELSKVPGLFVIARNSAFVYKGSAHNLPDVAAALGVRYVLEGSVRKVGNRVRVTAQLIDGASGGHLWAERYDRELEDIFAVQDEVTEAIVSQLSLRLAPEEKESASRHGTSNMAAWDLYLRGRESAWTLTPGSAIEAVRILRQVLSLDADFAAAHAMLGFTLVSQYMNGWGGVDETTLADGIAEAETAVRLDAREPLGHLANAMRLDPFFPNVLLHLSALGHYMLGDYQGSRSLLEQRMALKVETDSTPFVLAACCGRLGEPEAARKAWQQVFQANPDFSIARRRRVPFYRDMRHFEDIVDGVRMAGIDPEKPAT